MEKSVDLNTGGDAFDWLLLAMAYRHTGNVREARRWYQKALRAIHGKEPVGFQNFSHLYHLRDLREEAEMVMKRTRSIRANLRNG